jgi:hypothetical protein
MKLCLAVLVVLLTVVACSHGGQMANTAIDLGVAARWDGALPPPGSVATVDFYVMVEGTGSWVPIDLNVPYPQAMGALVDTFWYQYNVPTNGDHVTYRYEVDLAVGGEVYNFSCESGMWWWYAAGEIYCKERER